MTYPGPRGRETVRPMIPEIGWLRASAERARVWADADGDRLLVPLEDATRAVRDARAAARQRLTDPDPDGGTREQKLVEILSRLTDPDPCSYDHHGACRAHNLHERPCPHGAAKDLLRELRPEGTDA